MRLALNKLTYAIRIALGLMLLLGLCGASCTKRDVIVDTRPSVEITKRIYVPVPAELTAPCAIAEGTLAQVIDVARARKASLEDCNGKLKAISGLQGTPKDTP